LHWIRQSRRANADWKSYFYTSSLLASPRVEFLASSAIFSFANLAIGILGIIAVGRRDGFREATVITVAVFGVGATIVHLMDIVQTGNLAPGNTVQNVSNLLKPALLIGILGASRRAERKPDSEAGLPGFEEWRTPRIQSAWWVVIGVYAGFGVGFAIGQPVIATLLGFVAGAILAVISLRRR